ncbi:glycosyltransferase [Nodosilinea sp. FACHB-131]|uniref:glycosyltransferase n=1 Tax=Cyanophyceae TaxID=3028117 RepID=UPI0016832BFB|nr:glycosyltransferase [Nodosilinea sp. FACHB-131]MBD1872378.1 glycosyltransferase [Nodosilinea sp. FACHB-131]
MSQLEKKNIVIFNSILLAKSETFIKAQAESLKEYNYFFAGSRSIEGISLPPQKLITVNRGGVLGFFSEGFFKVSGFAPRFYQDLGKLEPSLIHAHFGLSGSLALPVAAKMKLPLVVTFHGSDATSTDQYARKASLNHRIYLRRRERLKKDATTFIAVSNFIKAKLLEKGFPDKKIVVHYIGVDIEKFTPKIAVKRKPTILFVGRLTEKKGLEYLIQAMAKVEMIMPEIELLIVGDGPLRKPLENLASQTLTNYRFLGSQPHDKIRDLMNESMLLAAPSVTSSTGDSEGLPMVILEALAMGLPIVSSFHAGIPEAVLHGRNGLLAQEKDFGTIADHILLILQNRTLWQKFSMAGRSHVVENFDLRNQAIKLEEIYSKAVEEATLLT